MEITNIAKVRSATGVRLLHVPRKDPDGSQHLIVCDVVPASHVEGAAPDNNANGFFCIPKSFVEIEPDESINACF